MHDETEDDRAGTLDYRPQTPRQLREYILMLTGDGRIVDEIDTMRRWLACRGIVGDRMVDWIEHAALTARSKNDAGPYFRAVLQGCLRKGGTPPELAEAEESRKALANAPVQERDRLATADRMTRFEIRFETTRRALADQWIARVEAFVALPEEERAAIEAIAARIMGDRAVLNQDFFVSVCAGIHADNLERPDPVPIGDPAVPTHRARAVEVERINEDGIAIYEWLDHPGITVRSSCDVGDFRRGLAQGATGNIVHSGPSRWTWVEAIEESNDVQ